MDNPAYDDDIFFHTIADEGKDNDVTGGALAPDVYKGAQHSKLKYNQQRKDEGVKIFLYHSM